MLFKQGFHFKPSPQAIYTDLLLRSRSKCRNKRRRCKQMCHFIRMKTANDFNKHLEEFRSGMSAGNILQAACSTKKRIGDVPIYK